MFYLNFYASLLFSVFFAGLFFHIGAIEYGSGYVPCLLSVALSLLAIFTMSGGFLTLLTFQIVLFCGLWVYNCFSGGRKI